MAAAAAAAATSDWDGEDVTSWMGSASSGMRSKVEVGEALLLLFVFIILRTSMGLTLTKKNSKIVNF